MNKKVLGLSAIFIVAVLAMGAVSATDLSNHDFGDYFSMKTPDVNFEKQENSTGEEGFEMDMVSYVSEDLVIFYSDSPLFSEDSCYSIYQMMFGLVNPDLTECYESQEGNLRILEPTTNDETHFALVGVNSGNKTVMLFGNDVDLLSEMGHTIKFK